MYESKKSQKMVRNPFKKSDGGCSFVFIIVLFVLVQIAYFYFYIEPAYIRDNRQVLIDIAATRGYKFDKMTGKYMPPLKRQDLELE